MSTCYHDHVEPCPLCEANREVGEAWAKEAIAAELAMDLANALDAEHSRYVHDSALDSCAVCLLLYRAREWAA